MGIQIECHQCRKQYNVRDENAGKRLKCKKCGYVISIPAHDEFEEDWDRMEDAASPMSPSHPPRRSKKMSSRRRGRRSAKSGNRSSTIYMAVGGGLLLVIGLIVGGIFLFSGGENQVPADESVAESGDSVSNRSPKKSGGSDSNTTATNGKTNQKRVASEARKFQNWKPDEALLSKLSAEIPIPNYEHFTVRPPAGWRMSNYPKKGGTQSVTWFAKQNPDGTFPKFEILLIDRIEKKNPRYPRQTKGTSEYHAGHGSWRIKKGYEEWQESEYEIGTINDLSFARQTWTEDFKSKSYQGIVYGVYGVVTEGVEITFYLKDGIDPSNTSLSLAEAAVRTFRQTTSKTE
jgi:hypothetical protein